MAKVFGAKLHGDRLRRLSGNVVRSGIADAVAAGAELIAQEARDSIIEGGISGPSHIASAPGETPNADTHELDQSIRVENNRISLVSRVTADAEYAIPLEFGTANMAERPFMGPAGRKKRPEARRLVLQAVNRANRGVI